MNFITQFIYSSQNGYLVRLAFTRLLLSGLLSGRHKQQHVHGGCLAVDTAPGLLRSGRLMPTVCIGKYVGHGQRCKPAKPVEKVELEPTKLQNSKEVGEENHVSGKRERFFLPSVPQPGDAVREPKTKWDPITNHH